MGMVTYNFMMIGLLLQGISARFTFGMNIFKKSKDNMLMKKSEENKSNLSMQDAQMKTEREMGISTDPRNPTLDEIPIEAPNSSREVAPFVQQKIQNDGKYKRKQIVVD